MCRAISCSLAYSLLRAESRSCIPASGLVSINSRSETTLASTNDLRKDPDARHVPEHDHDSKPNDKAKKQKQGKSKINELMDYPILADFARTPRNKILLAHGLYGFDVSYVFPHPPITSPDVQRTYLLGPRSFRIPTPSTSLLVCPSFLTSSIPF